MKPLEILLAGDVNCTVGEVLADEPLAPLAGLFDAADVRLGNLEGAFFDAAVGLDYKPGWRHCDPEGIKLIEGKFDAVACANNVHFGEAIGVSSGILDAAGIAHTGAGANLAAAREPAIVERGGQRVGVLAYTAVFWPIGHAATQDRAGVAVVRNSTAYEPHPRLVEMPGAPARVRSEPHEDDIARIRDDVRSLRGRVDVVVVYFHWGVTGQDEIAEYQRTLGRAAIDAGADIVAGSHPHIPQGVEFYQTGVILYSLGNFMFGWILHQHMTRDGLVALVDTDSDRGWRLSLVPVRRDDEGRIAWLRPGDADADRIMSRVAELSTAYGTSIEPAGDRYAVRPADGAGAFGMREHGRMPVGAAGA